MPIRVGELNSSGDILGFESGISEILPDADAVVPAKRHFGESRFFALVARQTWLPLATTGY